MEPFVAEYLARLERENNWLFHKLLEYQIGGMGRIYVSFFFNAYQPRANKNYCENRKRAVVPDNPFFNEYAKAIASYGTERNECDNLIKVAVTDCYVPLLAASKFFPSSISIAFPQVTLDLVRNFYPNVYAAIVEQNNAGEFDLGMSAYHHSFAPMLRERELMQEYLYSLHEFQKIDKRKNEFITLHIPECAVSPTLLEVLGKIQNDKGIRFVTVLDSEYHNTWPHPYDIGKPNELLYIAKGEVCRLRILFSNNYFSRKLFSFPPPLSVRDTAFWYFTKIFECIVKSQPYPYWEILKRGEDVCFVVHTDAETIGFHAPGREYAFFLFLHLLKSFDFKLTTISELAKKEPQLTKESGPLLYKTWDMETHGLTDRWMKKRDSNSSAQLLFTACNVIPYLIDDIKENIKEKERKLRAIERRLRAAELRFANALTSCPHWWPNPDSIPGKQFARDIIACSEHLQKLEKYVSEKRKNLLNAVEDLKKHPFIKRSGITS